MKISTTCKLISILFPVGCPKEISSHRHVGFWFEKWHATRSLMDCQCQHHHKWLNDLYLPCDMNMSKYRNSINPMSKVKRLVSLPNSKRISWTTGCLYFNPKKITLAPTVQIYLYLPKWLIPFRFIQKALILQSFQAPIPCLKHLCCLHVVVTNSRACDASQNLPCQVVGFGGKKGGRVCKTSPQLPNRIIKIYHLSTWKTHQNHQHDAALKACKGHDGSRERLAILSETGKVLRGWTVEPTSFG